MSDLELFSYEACPYAQRTRMLLIEKGIKFSLTEVDLYNKPDWWKELSPYGKVPLIRHNGGVIYESRIINEYIEEVFPSPAMMPTDPLGRAKARIWIDYCDSYLMPALHDLIADRRDEEKQEKNRTKVAEKLSFLEHEGFRKLGNGPFIMGDTLTLVDLQFMPFIERFPCYEELWSAYIPDDCTMLRKWVKVMEDRDSHQETMKPFEFHLERYRRYDEAA